ncbi:MAG: arginase, partial [Bacteroidetes bacterium]
MEEFFNPVDLSDILPACEEEGHRRIGDLISLYTETGTFPEFEEADLALIGVPEDRHAVNNEGCAKGPDLIRKFLYQLFPG